MENKPLISVIVPVYNAGQYLTRCIECLIIQDIYELILVNDGSTDNSIDICDKYGSLDVRLRVFHRENNGVSSARNFGISKATGDWIAFVDADDWVESSWLDVLKKNITLIKADLYKFGFQRTDENCIRIAEFSETVILNNSDFITTPYYHFAVWSYVFKSKIIKENYIEFPENMRYLEDQAFLLKYISLCKDVCIINKKLYNYFIHPNSTVSLNIDTFNWAISNLIVANDLLLFCKLNKTTIDYYNYPVNRLYESFLSYYKSLRNKRIIRDQKVFRKFYLETRKLFPEFKKQTTFRLAYISLFLPEILKIRKIISKHLK